MKKFVMGFFVAVLCAGPAQATASTIVEEASFHSTDELPAHSAIDGMWDVGTSRLSCPRGYVVGKRYCWDYASKAYTPCGVFCVKHPNPPGGGNDRGPEAP